MSVMGDLGTRLIGAHKFKRTYEYLSRCTRNSTKHFTKKYAHLHGGMILMTVSLVLLILIFPLYSAQIYGSALTNATTLNCKSAVSCVTCVQHSSCFWCESRRSCKILPEQEGIKDCAKWSRNSCEQSSTPVALIVSATFFGIIICGR